MDLITNVLLLEYHITLPSLRKSAHQGNGARPLAARQTNFRPGQTRSSEITRNLRDAISEPHISPKSSFFWLQRSRTI